MRRFLLSLLYELYRATAKAGTSEHDSMAAFAKNNIVFYAIASAVIVLLFVGPEWASWVGLLFSILAVGASIFYYNPQIMMKRLPGPIDWFEDLVFTGLLLVAAVLLQYDVRDVTLHP